jgi:cell filamentation protein
MFFCRYELIEGQSDDVFGAIANDNYLVGLSREVFIAKLADHWGEVNALHPFREGNTRAQRVFFQQLAQVAGWPIDWSRLDYGEFIKARYENLRTADSTALAEVLNPAVGKYA